MSGKLFFSQIPALGQWREGPGDPTASQRPGHTSLPFTGSCRGSMPLCESEITQQTATLKVIVCTQSRTF